MRKKKLLFQSDYALAKTGFGRNAKAVLNYLYDTDKYEIVHYCCGLPWSSPQLQRTPWKGYGTLPDDQQEQQDLGRDPHVGRQASYGAHNLDKIIQKVKPDVYIAVQDIWGIDFAIEKKWFKNGEIDGCMLGGTLYIELQDGKACTGSLPTQQTWRVK